MEAKATFGATAIWQPAAGQGTGTKQNFAHYFAAAWIGEKLQNKYNLFGFE